MTTLTSYVCGRWHQGSGTLTPLFNPATEEQVAQCGTGGVDFAAAVRHAREVGAPALRPGGFAARAAMLDALAGELHGRREELIELSIRNGGNTRGDAKFDVDGATGTLAAYAALGKRLGERDLLADGDGVQLGRTARYWGQHARFPRRGVAVHVNAFNFPAWGMAEKLACAVLAGSPVISKPGTPSALLAWRVAEIAVQSGALPEGALQLVAGSAGDLLDHLGPLDALAFTGSSATGRKLRGHENLLRHNVRVNIEADSLNAAIVGADVGDDGDTWQQLVANVALDVTQKAGQKCTAVRRVFVPADRVDRLVEELHERLAAVVVGDPADEATRMGPLASAAQLRDVRAGIDALAAAGRVACGGSGAIAERGYFVAPTIVVLDDPRSAVVHRDEVFGPVVSVLPYSGGADEAVELANLGGGGLVASVYSDDRVFAERVTTGIAPWHGRVWLGSEKVAGQALPPGLVLPLTVHGGPGRAGGGEELGGLRGLELYLQRTAVQGFQGIVQRAFGPSAE